MEDIASVGIDDLVLVSNPRICGAFVFNSEWVTYKALVTRRVEAYKFDI